MAVRKSRKPVRAASRKAAPKKAMKQKTVMKSATTQKTRAAAERRRNKPETLRLRSIEPSLTVNDLDRSMRFYIDTLGFVVSERWTDGGVLKGVSLKAGVCELNLAQDDWAKGRDRRKGEGVRMWCNTGQDIDALARRITAAGGHLSEEPKTQSWGVRSLSLADPDGFLLSIYTEV